MKDRHDHKRDLGVEEDLGGHQVENTELTKETAEELAKEGRELRKAIRKEILKMWRISLEDRFSVCSCCEGNREHNGTIQDTRKTRNHTKR